jgi:hypothetical protein
MSTGFISNGEDLANIFPLYQIIVTSIQTNNKGNIFVNVPITNPFNNTYYFVQCSIEHVEPNGNSEHQLDWHHVSRGCGVPVIVDKGPHSFTLSFTNTSDDEFWQCRLLALVIYTR